MKRAPLWLVLIVSACSGGCVGTRSVRDPPRPDGGTGGGSASTEVPTVVREPVLTASGVIWDLAFLPDGSALFTVRAGEVRRWVPGTSTSTVVGDRSSPGAPLGGLLAQGQGGLQGIAVDPAFASNRRIYLYLSHSAGGVTDNRVLRLRVTEDFTLTERADIVTGIPYKAAATKDGSPGAHNGGRLRFGPDGLLYLTTGDNHNATIPQSVDALGGKVLRFTTDGTPAPDNPGVGPRNLIWALGFRNPQGLDFHPLTGSVFISEHGPGNDDEVTRITGGANGGWNPRGATGEYNGYDGARMTDTTAVPSAVAPVFVHQDSQGMSACAFLEGPQWKAYQNRLAVGFLAGTKILALELADDESRVVDSAILPDVTERVRSLVFGPDGKLYVSTDTGLIYRLAPQ